MKGGAARVHVQPAHWSKVTRAALEFWGWAAGHAARGDRVECSLRRWHKATTAWGKNKPQDGSDYSALATEPQSHD